MFHRLEELRRTADAGSALTMTIDGQPVVCRAGDTVAAALFASGALDCRDTAVSGTPRGPYCMMGVCYDCLVVIDGRPNQQACMTLARAGMVVARQPGAREVA